VSKTPAAIAAARIEEDILDRRGMGELATLDRDEREEILAAWTTIIAQACADARAEERERVARLFDEEARVVASLNARASQSPAQSLSMRESVAMLQRTAARIRASETSGTTPTPAQRGDHVGAAAPNLTEDGDEDPFNDPAQEGDGSW